jgi:hypothetical protein
MRAEFVSRAEADPALRDEVLELLRHHHPADESEASDDDIAAPERETRARGSPPIRDSLRRTMP